MRDAGVVNDKLLSLFEGSCFNNIESVQKKLTKGLPKDLFV